MENVSTRRWIFHCPSLLERRAYQSSSRILRLHCTSWTNWNNREIVEVRRSYIFKWRFRCRCRRRCLSSLISSRREFHSLIVRGKKENLKTSSFPLGTSNLKGWLPRVLLSLFGFRWAATEKSVSLWESLYIKDNLAVFLLVAGVSKGNE